MLPYHAKSGYRKDKDLLRSPRMPFRKMRRKWIAQTLFASLGLFLLYRIYFSPSSVASPAVLDPVPAPAPSPVFAPSPGVLAPNPVLADSIPQKIWQIFFPPPSHTPDRKLFRDTSSWLALNSDHTYTLLGPKGANEYVASHYAHRPDIVGTFAALGSPVLKSDFLRYLILASEGGTYTDLDTVAIKPIGEWIPSGHRDRARVIVGIEYDQRDAPRRWPGLTLSLQFCQWTLSAAPGHPLLNDMIERVMLRLHALASRRGTTLEGLKPDVPEVWNTTGPVAWSEAVFESIRASTASLPQQERVSSWRDLSKMTGPTLYGDVLVFPINAFGSGQPHSGSIRDGPSPDILVKHGFRGSWKSGW